MHRQVDFTAQMHHRLDLVGGNYHQFDGINKRFGVEPERAADKRGRFGLDVLQLHGRLLTGFEPIVT